MKYTKIIILLLVLISSNIILEVIKDKEIINNISEITSKSILKISTKATSILATISVFVDTDFPKIYIASPENKTYTTTSLELNFTIVEDNLDKTYYNIDDGANTTITANTTFTTTLGSHTLKLFANDTLGRLNSSSVTFAVTSAPAAEAAAAPAGGAGGGKGISVLTDFSVSTNLIKVALLQGETKIELIEIENIGTSVLNLEIDLEGIKDFLIFPGGVSKYALRLKPGEKQSVQLIFSVAKDYKPGVYPGKIIVSSQIVQKTITTVVEVESAKKIFDVDIKIQDKKVVKGANLIAEIIIFNLGQSVGRVDTQVEFGIKDLEGTIIQKEDIRIAVETQASFTESILIPKYLADGRYVFYATVTFDNETGTASEVFEVISRPPGFLALETVYIYIISGFISIIIILIILEYLRRRYRKEYGVKEEKPNIITKIMQRSKKKFDINKFLKEEVHGGHKKILELELKILKQNYELGLISQEEYLKRKRKIERKL